MEDSEAKDYCKEDDSGFLSGLAWGCGLAFVFWVVVVCAIAYIRKGM